MTNPIFKANFPAARRQGLEAIERYSMFETMFYRPNLWLHSHRVAWLIEELSGPAKKIYPKIDMAKSVAIGFVHDDAEIIMGDYQAGHKALMTKAQLLKIEQEEKQAINKLAKQFPEKAGPYVYQKLLLEALEHKSIEAQLANYADKLDGFCEGIHEALAGNTTFIGAVIFYTNRLAHFGEKFPKLRPLLEYKNSPLTDLMRNALPAFVKADHYKKLGKPFTKQSIKQPTDFPFYNVWRNLTIKNWGEAGTRALIKQKEFLS